jgi:hypothetical protein
VVAMVLETIHVLEKSSIFRFRFRLDVWFWFPQSVVDGAGS